MQLYQKDVATKLHCDLETLIGWEKNRYFPELRFIPKIIEFLGYNPLPKPKNTTEEIIQYRQLSGITQNQLAEELGVDPSTLSRWERGIWPKSDKCEVLSKINIEKLP